MNKRHDLIGRQFGGVTVVKISDKRKNRGFLWECLCKCGTICYDTTQNLETGHRLSCGCSRKETIDLTGFRTGMLIVVEFTGIKSYDETHSERRWKCLCDCGEYTELSTAVLTKGRVRSCGCLNTKSGNEHHGWKGYGEISASMWKQIKSCASSRDLQINLSIEYLWDLFNKQNKQCALSGVLLTFGKKKQGITASLDRIDSSIGYIESNVQWVHKDINKMKSDFNQSYFIKLCEYVNNNRLGRK